MKLSQLAIAVLLAGAVAVSAQDKNAKPEKEKKKNEKTAQKNKSAKDSVKTGTKRDPDYCPPCGKG